MVNKSKEEPKPPPQKELPVKVPVSAVTGVPLCACGKPVAPGQTFVCTEHIRSN